MGRRLKILIDFDGTLCKEETIPYVAKLLGISKSSEIETATYDACRTNCDYEDNLRMRIAMMDGITVGDFTKLLFPNLLRSSLVDFILSHRDICEIVSCNLDCWCRPLTDFLGVSSHFSQAEVKEDKVKSVVKILDKQEIVEKYRRDGYYVVFVGDSANDIAAMKAADIAILLVNGLITADWDENKPVEGVKKVDSEEQLTDILYSLVK